MISNRRSTVQPPNRPSAVSASPSSCSAPVIRDDTARQTAATQATGSPSISPTDPASATAAPTIAPTIGQAQADAAPRDASPATPRTGNRVSSPNAARISPAKSMSRRSMEWSFPGWSFVPVLGSQSQTFNARDDVMTFASLADFRALLWAGSRIWQSGWRAGRAPTAPTVTARK